MTHRVLGVTYRVLGDNFEYSVSRTTYSVALGGSTEYLVTHPVILGMKTVSHGEILIVRVRVELSLGVTPS